MDDPKPGSYCGWKEGGKRRYGLFLSVDQRTGEWWCLRLHRPWRRVARRPDETTVLAEPTETLDAFDDMAVDFARNAS